MKKISTLLLLFVLFFIQSSSSQAAVKAEFGPFKDQPTNKVWTITFNAPVSPIVTIEHIYVAEKNDGTLRLETPLEVEGNTVKVHPPVNGYTEGNTYYLNVTKDVLNDKNKPLKKQQTVTFTIEKPTDEVVTEPSKEFNNRVEELNSNWKLATSISRKPMFLKKPVLTAPYDVGVIDPAIRVSGVNMVNFVRSMAYLPSNITGNTRYIQQAQAAAFINSVNHELSHTPTRPDGMDETLFQLGYDGASASNIANYYDSIQDAIQFGFMPDSSVSNRADLGHRRWILSPKLHSIGIGYSVAADDAPYWAMVVSDPTTQNKLKPADYDYIAWPSKEAFPTSFISGEDPWSVSLQPKQYQIIDNNNVSVTLTNKRTNDEWKFNNAESDGFFNISAKNYGYTENTIVFQPEGIDSYKEYDNYSVRIEGIHTVGGTDTSLEYETTFFELTN